MSINTELNHDGVSWKVLEQGEELATYGDFDVRLSLSWKAKVYSNNQTYKDLSSVIGNIDIGEAIERFNQELGSDFSDLNDDELQQQLSQRWNGYVL